jgi:benzoyl-CoA reductase/2-hydroxyglutaryl-CoA dehydratase subunit BcrC/BadD/HgdB
MTEPQTRYVGFCCAYTPLSLLDAAGFVPYRILPITDAPDQAGSIVHDNLCPHVKRILDRALSGELPELSGLVVVESCDTMRRLADAWQVVRPEDRIASVDLPLQSDSASVDYFTRELVMLRDRLSEWSGREVADASIAGSNGRYNELATRLRRLRERIGSGQLSVSWARLQEISNHAVTHTLERTLEELSNLESTVAPGADVSAVEVLLIGNVLADPGAFELLRSSGVRLVGDELCTGSRQLTPFDFNEGEPPLPQLARGILGRPPCARTLVVEGPGGFADRVVRSVSETGARGVIAHVMKFCDPYLARIPAVRAALREAGIPLLVLEGDCTMRSLGQHRTRIEAFVEMIAEGVA